MAQELIGDWTSQLASTSFTFEQCPAVAGQESTSILVTFHDAYRVKVAINARSGQIKLELVDFNTDSTSDLGAIVFETTKMLEQDLNLDRKLLVQVLNDLKSAARLHGIQLQAVSLGFEIVKDLGVHDPANPLKVFLKTAAMEESFIEVCLARYKPTATDSAYTIVLTTIEPTNFTQSTFEVSNHDARDETVELGHANRWDNLDSDDLLRIHRVCVRYIGYSSVCDTLNSQSIPFSYVLPPSFVASKNNNDKLILKCPILCVSFAAQVGMECSAFVQYLPDPPVDLFSVGYIPTASYKAMIRVPKPVVHCLADVLSVGKSPINNRRRAGSLSFQRRMHRDHL